MTGEQALARSAWLLGGVGDGCQVMLPSLRAGLLSRLTVLNTFMISRR